MEQNYSPVRERGCPARPQEEGARLGDAQRVRRLRQGLPEDRGPQAGLPLGNETDIRWTWDTVGFPNKTILATLISPAGGTILPKY